VRTIEEPEAAARRETAEELGITRIGFEPLGTYPAKSKRRVDVVSVFSGEVNSVDLSPSQIELSEVGFFSRPNLPEDLDPNVSLALGLLDGRNAELAAARRRTV
jgi:8-oxo-dGTP pyrophosphatase MutT (NUDIX family)